MAMKTQGTSVWVRILTGAVYSLVKVGAVAGVDGLGGAKDQIDITDLESDEREFLAGFANPGAASLPVNYDIANASHAALETLYDSGDVCMWIVGLSDGPKATAPTVVAGTGVVTWPATRSYIDFQGYISDLPLNLALNDAIRTPMQVQRSGKRNLHKKT